MAIRAYRKPIEIRNHYAAQPQEGVRFDGETPYVEIFVILEAPLLEFTQKDLTFLRSIGISPFLE